MTDNVRPSPNIQELSKKGEAVYNLLALNPDFIKNNNGKFIAIDAESGNHFIGETKEAAVDAAHVKYPGKILFVRRIGDIEKMSRHFSSTMLKNKYQL